MMGQAGDPKPVAPGELPLVTVITPAYNRASYLDETIRSVLGQDYPNLEYIVLDDGSTDNTREVLGQYDGRISWETHPNMGETGTVNKGFGLARGEIVVVVNSDDPLLPGAVRTAVDFMQAHPRVLVAYPDWNFIGPKSEVMEHIRVREYDYRFMVGHHFCTPGPGAFIRRRAIEAAGGRDPSFRYVADFEFWLRVARHGTLARIPATLATFRVHPSSASVSDRGEQMAQEHIRLVEHVYAAPGLPPEILKVRRQAFAWANYAAAATSGRSRRRAARYYCRALGYYPLILYDMWFALAWRLARRSPPPLQKRLYSIWYGAGSIFRKKEGSAR